MDQQPAEDLQVKGRLGFWSTRFFKLVSEDETQVVLECLKSSVSADLISSQAVTAVTDMPDRAGARSNRFNLVHEDGNESCLCAPSAESKSQWLAALASIAGITATRGPSQSVAGAADEEEEEEEGEDEEEASARRERASERLGAALVRMYTAAFEEADAPESGDSPDGVLNLAELAAAAELLGASPSQAELAELVRDADGDGDGGVDLTEFLEAMCTRRWGDGAGAGSSGSGEGEEEDEEEDEEDEDESKSDDGLPGVMGLKEWFDSDDFELQQSVIGDGPFAFLFLPGASGNAAILESFRALASELLESFIAVTCSADEEPDAVVDMGGRLLAMAMLSMGRGDGGHGDAGHGQ